MSQKDVEQENEGTLLYQSGSERTVELWNLQLHTFTLQGLFEVVSVYAFPWVFPL